MAHRVQPAVIRKTQTLGVIKNLSVVELSEFLYFGKEFLAANARAVEVFVPLLQVFDGGVHGAVAGLFEVGDIELVAGLVLLFIVGQRAIGNQRGVVVAILRVCHFQRRKNIVGREFAQ